jgi:hypothetical protein
MLPADDFMFSSIFETAAVFNLFRRNPTEIRKETPSNCKNAVSPFHPPAREFQFRANRLIFSGGGVIIEKTKEDVS